ncbi:MAG: hypothetical protein AAGD38_18390 [Acidobacteriota bacterium]
MDNLNEAQELLQFALSRSPERVEVVDVTRLVTDSARGNDKRHAWIKVSLPDDDVKALRGPADRRDTDILLVRVPREVSDRRESRIILPGE